MTSSYINDKLNGERIKYFESGVLKEKENYILGEQNGEHTTYYENKQLRKKTNYINGKLNGEWITYYKNGQINCSSPLIDQTRSDKVKLINFKSNNYEYKKINIRRKSKDCSGSRTNWLYRNILEV